MFNKIFPTFLIASITHSDLLFIFAKVLALEEEVRAPRLVDTLLMAKNLSTITTMMFAPEQRVELLITFETVMHCAVWDPFLLRAEGRLYYFTHFLVHDIIIINN